MKYQVYLTIKWSVNTLNKEFQIIVQKYLLINFQNKNTKI